MFDRILRAVKLDSSLFREVAARPDLIGEAAIIVVIVAIFSGAGSMPGVTNPVLTFGLHVVSSILLGWLLWSILAYFIGTNIFHGNSSLDAMLRTLGYANAPNLLGILGVIPCIGWIFAVAGAILSLIAGIIGIREAMKFSTGDAVITAIIGWLINGLAFLIISAVLAAATVPFR
jgi:Yip1 domain